MSQTEFQPLLMVISGPSGVGKDALLKEMKRRSSERVSNLMVCYVVTATTRLRRPEEVDGVDYYFLSEVDFRRMIEEGRFLEWVEVYGNLYGVPLSEVENARVQGKDLIVKVDVQGAATIKKLFPQAILIFIAPPSMEELTKRLKQRRTESPEEIELRLRITQQEMETRPLFSYVIVNQDIDVAVSQIETIITVEKRRNPYLP